MINGPSIVMGLSPGQQLACDWYNVPGGLGMVSIWTQACPEGVDAATATPLQLEQRCSDDIESVDYTLTSGSFTRTGGNLQFVLQGGADLILNAASTLDRVDVLLANGSVAAWQEAVVGSESSGLKLAEVNAQLNFHRPGRGGNSARFVDDLLTTGATPLLRAAIMHDHPVEKYLRDAASFLHSDGTNQVCLLRAAEGLAAPEAAQYGF